jgi:hypothetical protein
MATWIATAVPLIPEVIRLATPYFSKKPADKALDLAASVAELQDASRTNAGAITKNAEALAAFAENTQKYIEALQTSNVALHRELAVARTVAIVAATIAGLAFALAAYGLAA